MGEPINLILKIFQIYLSIKFLLALLAPIILIIRYCRDAYKKIKNDIEKSIYICTIIAAILPMFVYFLDRFNIPTQMGYTQNINATEWMNNIINYAGMILSTFISAAFLIFITLRQMEETSKENKEAAKEEQRINNMPLLKYEFDDKACLNGDYILNTKYSKFICMLNITITNVGMNTARKCIFEITSPSMKKSQILNISSQSCIDKNKPHVLKLSVPLTTGDHNFEIVVYYQDLLFNCYKQKIDLLYSVNDNGSEHIIIDNVFDELLLQEIPNILNKQ